MENFRMFRAPLIPLLAVVLLAASTAQAAEIELTAGMYRITAEVANTDASRERGLMHRREMADGHGMVFVFPSDESYCMWMQNTLIPLAVAFLDDKGAITNIEEMQPQTRTPHCAKRPARYALEMNGGWFQRRGIAPGSPLGGIDKLPPAQ